MTDPVKVKVTEVQVFTRDVKLRLPFRFGVVTLTEAPQCFVRLRLKLKDGREGWGFAAELMVPKWFDKNPELTNEDNFSQLRSAIFLAKSSYLASDWSTPFDLTMENYSEQIKRASEQHLNPLIASYGPALLDRAILDAFCRLHEISFYKAIRANLVGFHGHSLIEDLDHLSWPQYLESLKPNDTIHFRHTVGLLDPITAQDMSDNDRLGDGLPETLEEVVKTYGHRYFKIKVSGDLESDVSRLKSIAALLDKSSDKTGYSISLDGNEQFSDIDKVVDFWQQIAATQELKRFVDSIMYIEQPLKRDIAVEASIEKLTKERPVIIDESDSQLDSFLQAKEVGYQGVSTKNCKGFYKSLINAARCHLWNSQTEVEGSYFISAEDLTCQPGVALQQDLALVNLLGCRHVERNGHHYVYGMAGASDEEQANFVQHHSDLYHLLEKRALVRLKDGQVQLSSLDCTGFAVAAEPEWQNMKELEEA